MTLYTGKFQVFTFCIKSKTKLKLVNCRMSHGCEGICVWLTPVLGGRCLGPQRCLTVFHDWLIEQGLTSTPTPYRLSGRQFYRSKDPTNSIKVPKEKSIQKYRKPTKSKEHRIQQHNKETHIIHSKSLVYTNTLEWLGDGFQRIPRILTDKVCYMLFRTFHKTGFWLKLHF